MKILELRINKILLSILFLYLFTSFAFAYYSPSFSFRVGALTQIDQENFGALLAGYELWSNDSCLSYYHNNNTSPTITAFKYERIDYKRAFSYDTVSKNDFSGLGLNVDEVWQKLIDAHYIDEKGNINREKIYGAVLYNHLFSMPKLTEDQNKKVLNIFREKDNMLYWGLGAGQLYKITTLHGDSEFNELQIILSLGMEKQYNNSTSFTISTYLESGLIFSNVWRFKGNQTNMPTSRYYIAFGGKVELAPLILLPFVFFM